MVNVVRLRFFMFLRSYLLLTTFFVYPQHVKTVVRFIHFILRFHISRINISSYLHRISGTGLPEL